MISYNIRKNLEYSTCYLNILNDVVFAKEDFDFSFIELEKHLRNLEFSKNNIDYTW